MSDLRSLISAIRHDSSRHLPPDVYRALVVGMIETPRSILVSSVVGVLVVGLTSAYLANSAWVASLTVAHAVIMTAMMPLVARFRREGRAADTATLARWELRFALMSSAAVVTIGIMAASVYLLTDRVLAHFMVTTLTFSAASMMLRKHVRLRLVLAQQALLLCPPTLALAISGNIFYELLAIGAVAYIFNIVQIALGLYQVAIDALVTDDQLRTQNLRFDAAVNNMSHGLCMFGDDGTLLVCNARYLEMFRFSPDVVKPGISLRDLLQHSVDVGNHPTRTAEQVYDTLSGYFTVREPVTFHHAVGEGRTIAVAHQPMVGGWVQTFEDVTERQAAEARIAHMARHDALTGMPNRVQFREKLEEALTQSRKGDGQVAVLCIDLDRFKSVNDTLGHPIGDTLLKAVTERLQSCARNSDTVSRHGGDEFAIVQVGAAQPDGARQLAQRVVDTLGAPFEIEGHQLVVGASVGVAIAPDHAETPDQLLKNADLALYRAKADGRGRYRFFAPGMDKRMELRRALELDLRRALGGGEFELFYQPLVSVQHGTIGGFEALLRWRHPERGLVRPDEFIPLAEEIGLIGSLGEWVLREACTEATRWPEHVRVAVNLSPVQFKSGALAKTVLMALAASGLSANRLELEITENALLSDCETTMATLHRLRDLGVRIAMDDFGTGYSSLSYLRAFPFDKIKIDQSFIREIAHRSEAIAIVRAVTGLAKSLGMSTTAEGVETEDQLRQLRAEGCTEVQGFLVGAPMAPIEAERLITRDSRNYARA